jgi:hypothetical protein
MKRASWCHTSTIGRICGLAVLGSFGACTADIGSPGSGGPGNAAGGSGAAGGNSTGAGAPNGPSSMLGLVPGPAPAARLHKLTTVEFANSLHDLLGGMAPLGSVEEDLLIGGFATVGASSVAISPAGVGLYESAIGTATTYAFADAARAGAVVRCVPKAMTDAACLTQAIEGFGRRAFRRPLTGGETTRFVNLATTIGNQPGSNVLTALRVAMAAMLESPSFIYRVELGAPSPADGGRLKYNSFEVASRLAATLWTSVPDDVVLDAAGKGTLGTPEGIRAQAQRMIADPRAHRALAAFVDQLYDVRRLNESEKDPNIFPAWTETLRAAMQQELEMRVEDVVFTQKGDFLGLMDSRTTLVNNELARYYGVPEAVPDTFHRVELPAASQRVGLLGAGAILAAHALPQRTSPTARGKFVNEMLLCRTIPPPPPGVPPLPAMADASSTLRQRLSVHRSDPRCASCHAMTDPIGFGMENFDSAAKYRTLDNGQPIDASGTLGGSSFTNLAELGAALRKEPVLGPCLVSKMYANALGRAPIEMDGAALDRLAGSFASGGNHVDELLVNLVTSDSFRFVEPSSK